MSTIPGTSGPGDNGYSLLGLGAQSEARSGALGQADFLHLMTEQLKNQDPLKPLDSQQFLGQLAQFSTVQGEISARAAGPVTVDIVDANGVRVRRMTVEAGAAGATAFEWDGRDDAGEPIPAGRYAIRAVDGNADPGASDADLLPFCVKANVDSVSIESTGLSLNLAGLGSFPLSAVRRIG